MEKMNKSNELIFHNNRLVSLFAGIGGIDLAFSQVGFNVVWANDIDKFVCQTYKSNFPNHKLIEGDIRKIDFKDIPSHDILVAGFPCQSFSLAGKRQGLNDPRGNLFKEILRVAEYHKPSWLLLENVKGLTFKNNKEAFDQIIKGLEDLGYKVDWKVLNAKDFGVPQNRERIFIVGNRLGIDFIWPSPIDKPTKISDILENEVDEKYYLSDKAWEGMKTRKENGRGKGYSYNIVEHGGTAPTLLSRYYKSGNEILLFSETRKRGEVKIMEDNNSPTLRAGIGGGGGNVPYIFHWRKRNDPKRNEIEYLNNETAPALTSAMGMGGGHVPLVFQNWRYQTIREYKENFPCLTSGNLAHVPFIKNRSKNPRKLTPRECARLQGFNDDFKIVVSDSQAYKQFGNSVAIPVLKRLAKNIKESWIKKELR